MLKDWSYDVNSDPLQSDSADNTELDSATQNVIVNLSQELSLDRNKNRRQAEGNSQVKKICKIIKLEDYFRT